jgi:nucleoside-diphosphate-sugar epimerase
MIRVLFTGASSFTGSWFVAALASRGVEVVAPCRGGLGDGDEDRRRRLARVADRCRLIDCCPFGSEPFLDLTHRYGPFDLLCHHGAKAGDHRDASMDPLAAAAAQTHNLPRVLDALQGAGCRGVALTGTVFEADEGEGDRPLRAIGPYGLAKTLTWHIFRSQAEARGLPLGKFVIANPIGPEEKPGLCRSLAEAWLAHRTPVVRRPQLVRDQIQVELLAEAYADFVLELAARPGDRRLTPSQFAEPLDRFAERLARALAPRLGVPCRFAVAAPPDASDEPLRRHGVDPLEALAPAIDPRDAWDRHASWLLRHR